MADTARRLRPTALLVVAVVAVAVVAWAASDSVTAEREAATLPDVALVDLTDDTREVTLAELTGEPLVVNFYASWCPPCVGEMREAFGPVDREREDVVFVGVALQDDPDAALDVARRTDVDYALVADGEGALYQAFGLASMPATVYLGPDGEERGRHNGALTRAQLESQIAEHLDRP